MAARFFAFSCKGRPSFTIDAAETLSLLTVDVSGFTPLTEALARSLGPRRGAEELTLHLNSVYQALIQEVDRYGGSAIAFAGDAITCWFQDDDGRRAVTCARAMQHTMQQFSSIQLADGTTVALAVKVGIACGPTRRFVVGDPQIQVLDVLAGWTLSEKAAAAHLAGGSPLSPAEQQRLDKSLEAARNLLPPEHARDRYYEGARLTLEAAVALALNS